MARSATSRSALIIITTLGSWNDLLWPLVIAQDSDSWTVQVALDLGIAVPDAAGASARGG